MPGCLQLPFGPRSRSRLPAHAIVPAAAQINRETVAMRDAERVRRDLNGARAARAPPAPRRAHSGALSPLFAERTNEYVLYFSVLSTVCVLAVAAWQTYHLRRFFHSKKLI